MMYQIILLLTLIISVFARIGPVTQFDGIFTGKGINQYLQFSQNTGVQLRNVPDWQAKDSSEEFSFLAWFKLDKFPWDADVVHNMPIIYLSNKNLKCEIQVEKYLDCYQQEPTTNLFKMSLQDPQNIQGQNDNLLIALDQWYLIVLTSSNQQSSLYLYDISFTGGSAGVNGHIKKVTVEQSFKPFKNMQLGKHFDVYIGKDSKSYGGHMLGSIKQVQFISRNLYTHQLVKNAAFTYLFKEAEADLLFQVTLFNTTQGFLETVSKVQGIMKGSPAGIQPQIDFRSQFLCWDYLPEQYPFFIKFEGNNFLRGYQMNSKIYKNTNSKAGDYQSTLIGWVFRKEETLQGNEVLFEQKGIVKLEFESETPDQITITHLNDQVKKLPFPKGIWVYIASWHDSSGFGMHIQDINLELINRGSTGYGYKPRGDRYATGIEISIAPSFNGYIQGLKFYKGIQRTEFRAIDFVPEIEENPDLLWYFRFQKDGFQGINQFANKAKNSIQFPIGSTISNLNSLLIQFPTHKIGQVLNYTSLDWNTYWDGISCGRTSKKYLTFKQPNNFARANFAIDMDRQYTDITVEFWFKQTQQNQDQPKSATLLSIMKNDQQIFTIKINDLGNLHCYPFQIWKKNSNDHSVEYYDAIKVGMWQHFSCTVDSKLKMMRGSIFNRESLRIVEENGYVKDAVSYIDRFVLQREDADKLEIFVNSDGTGNGGMTNIQYADVRVWNYARTWETIKQQRHYIINYNTDMKLLISSFQFLNGGLMSGITPNLAQVSLPSINLKTNQQGISPILVFATLQGASWTEEQTVGEKLYVCPLLTFYDQLSQRCLRDGLQSCNVIFFKDKQSSQYVLTPRFSDFANPQMQNQINTYYQVTWELISAYGDVDAKVKLGDNVETNKNSIELKFPYDQLQDGGRYQFQVTIKDINFKQQRDIVKQYALATQDCVEFYDKKSNQSEIVLNIDSNKGSEDIFLEMEKLGCGQYSPIYAAMTYKFIDEATRPPNSIGVTYLADTKTIRILKLAQSYMPVNQDIGIIATANWYNQLIISVSYTLRWQTRVNVKVTASHKIVPLGSIVYLKTDKTEVINYSGGEAASAYTITWNCPTNLCTSTGDRMLTLTPKDFNRAKLEYWKVYSFTATSLSQFIQSDGSRTSSESYTLTWIPFDPEAKIIGDDYIYVDQVMILKLQTNGIGKEQTTVLWTSSPLVNINIYTLSDDSNDFGIMPYSLTIGTNYTFKMKITHKATGNTVWKGEKVVQVKQRKYNQYASINPYTGKAFETYFTIESHGWPSRKGVLYYQFFYQDVNDEYSVLTPLQRRSWINTRLPSTGKVIVQVKDDLGLIGTGVTTVYCSFQDESSSLNTQNALFQEATDSRDIETKMTKLSLISNNFNKFKSFRGFQTSKSQAKRIIGQLSTQSRQLRSLNSNDHIFFTQSAISTLSLITHNDAFFNLKQAITIQQIVKNLIVAAVSNNELNSLFQYDNTLKNNVISIQSNLLKMMEEQKAQGKVPSLVYGFKNEDYNNITEEMREIINYLDKFVVLGLKADEQFNQITEFIEFRSRKFNEKSNIKDWVQNFGQMNLSIPLDSASNPLKSDQTLSVIVFKGNPFQGSQYPSTSNIKQEVRSNLTSYISWRNDQGIYLKSARFPGTIDMTFDYQFQKVWYSQALEEQLTHCSYMNSDLKDGDDKILESSKCTTTITYEENKIKCSCQHMSFYTISRDQHLRPFSEAQGTFDFKNWASFPIFVWLMVLALFGLIGAQNMDHRELSKLNDMDGDQDTGIQSDQIQFPLQTFALKRQVFLMDFAADDLSLAKIFVILLANFHPLLNFWFRFDPVLSRQDRFLVLLLQVSLTLFASFMLFRNMDKPDPFGKELSIPTYEYIAFFSCFIGFALFTISPLPTAFYDCLRTKFILNEMPNFDDLSENEYLAEDKPDGPEDEEEKDGQEGENEDKKQELEESNIIVDPNIPLKFLFQLSAFSIPYLKKKGKARFPFLGGDRVEVGRALFPKEENEDQEEKKEEQKQVKKKEKKKRSSRRRNREEGKEGRNRRKNRERPEIQDPKSKELSESANEQGTNTIIGEDSQRRLVNGNGSFLGSSNVEQNPELIATDKQTFASRRALFTKQKKDQKALSVAVRPTPQNPQNLQIKENSLLMSDIILEPKDSDSGFQKEGGNEEDDTKSVNTDNMGEVHNEFTEDTDGTQQRLNRVRLLMYLIITGLLVSVLITFSLEGVHAQPKQFHWVILFFCSQILSFLLISPLWIFIVSAIVFKYQENKTFLSKYFYDQLVLLEDFKHVQNFQQQKFG